MSRSKLKGLNHEALNARDAFGVSKERAKFLAGLTVGVLAESKFNSEVCEKLWNNAKVKDNELCYVLLGLALERDRQALNVFLQKADSELRTALKSIRG